MLFLNVSAHKLAKATSNQESFYDLTESHAIIFIWCLEFSLIKLK
jgi:hypothetical protein